MHQILTFGYQGSTLEQLKAYQREHNALIVDIRFSPYSRDKVWCQPALIETFKADYAWCKSLGNVNYRTGGPIHLLNAEAGANWMARVLAVRPAIVVCACWNLETCHRKIAAEYVARQLGVRVEHLPASPAKGESRRLAQLTLRDWEEQE